MNEHMREDKPCCDFHPKEVIVGVCPLCLNERLLILAAKQDQGTFRTTTTHSSKLHRIKLKPPITLPKFFALGNSLLKFQHKQSDNSSYSDASASPEDSFISIKFEDNGVASWEKSKVSKVSLDHCNISWNHSLSNKETKGANRDKEAKSVVEHAKPRGSLRWRKRIGHLFQVTRWKRSSKGGSSHVGSKLDGVKVVRSGWIRTLTKRRTKE